MEKNEIPSRRSIVAGAVLSSWTATAWLWLVWWGDGGTGDMIGAFGWLLLTALVLGQTIGRVVRRGEAHVKRALNVAEAGIWRSRYVAEQVLTVRWDDDLRLHWIRGAASDDWRIERELAWTDSTSLARLITEAERDGMDPADDQVTRVIRARLGLPAPLPELGIRR